MSRTTVLTMESSLTFVLGMAFPLSLYQEVFKGVVYFSTLHLTLVFVPVSPNLKLDGVSDIKYVSELAI